ncbi:MAG: PilZ domain-containing protein [Terriglobia bacterium]|jgi:hypothetical protein
MDKEVEPTTEHRRRSSRIVLRIPLLMNTADPAVETQWEPVETILVSKHGAMVRSQQNFPVGSTLDIRVRNKELSAQARVVWTSATRTEKGVELGFEIIGQDGFWDIKFPPDQ